MLYILHGDDTVNLQKRLSTLVPNVGKATFLQADKAPSSEIINSLRSGDLFLDEKYVVIEKILKLDKKTLEKIIPELEGAVSSSSVRIILTHNTELSKVFLNRFKNARIEVFLMPKLFFNFLDNFTPHSMKRELDLLLKMQNVEAEQIFYALIKRVRLLLMLKSNSNSDEIVKINPWQLEKIKDQSLRWKLEDLEKIYKKLFDVEVKMKSGGLTLPLRKSLDIMLIAELN